MEGHVCLNILRTDWNPVLSLYAVLNGLLFLFYEPNPMDPLNFGVLFLNTWIITGSGHSCSRLHVADAAALLRSDQEAFKRKVALTLRGGSVDGKPFPRFC